MSNKILIDVFGSKNKYPVSSGCGCGSQLTMWEMYLEFSDLVENSDIKDLVEMRFMDVDEIALESYDNIINALASGYSLPLTTIDSNVRYQLSIPYDHIYRSIKRQMK